MVSYKVEKSHSNRATQAKSGDEAEKNEDEKLNYNNCKFVEISSKFFRKV